MLGPSKELEVHVESVKDISEVSANARASVLSVHNLEVVYSNVILVLRGVSLEVSGRQIVALLGANGAGKTTLIRAITGLLPVHRGKVTKGAIELDGEEIHHRNAAAIVRTGVAQVMEGRRIFAEMTVDENLRAGSLVRRDRVGLRDSYHRIMELFPVLADRRGAIAGYLSGGEQQMLAIAQALMTSPRLLLLDEPTLGLAPMFVEQLRDIIVEINRTGTGVLLVEQNASMALSIAHHGYVLETGKVVKEGSSADLLNDADIREFYLGRSDVGRKSFRDVKSYRRKKRWSS